MEIQDTNNVQWCSAKFCLQVLQFTLPQTSLISRVSVVRCIMQRGKASFKQVCKLLFTLVRAIYAWLSRVVLKLPNIGIKSVPERQKTHIRPALGEYLDLSSPYADFIIKPYWIKLTAEIGIVVQFQPDAVG